MKNFTCAIPTVVHFGQGQIQKLGGEIAARSRKVLVVYGGGSVKRNGVFDAAAALSQGPILLPKQAINAVTIAIAERPHS